MGLRHDEIMRQSHFVQQQLRDASQKQTEEMYLHAGQLTFLAVEGLLGYLAQLGTDRKQAAPATEPAINKVVDELVAKQATLEERVASLEQQIQHMQRGLDRLERLLLAHVQEQILAQTSQPEPVADTRTVSSPAVDSEAPAPGAQPILPDVAITTVTESEKVADAPVVQTSRFQIHTSSDDDFGKSSRRVSQAEVRERCFQARRRLEREGRKGIAAAEIAKAAGVKYHQFTYAFKNQKRFDQAYAEWVENDTSVA